MSNFKNVFLIVILLIIISIGVSIFLYSKDKLAISNYAFWVFTQNSLDVHEGVNTFLDSHKIVRLNKEEQIEQVGYLLTIYEKAEVINDLTFDKEKFTFFFTYPNGEDDFISY